MEIDEVGGARTDATKGYNRVAARRYIYGRLQVAFDVIDRLDD